MLEIGSRFGVVSLAQSKVPQLSPHYIPRVCKNLNMFVPHPFVSLCTFFLITTHDTVPSWDNMGAKMEVAKYRERLVPSTRFVAVDGVAPVVSETATFVAPSASVIGDVTLGSNSRYVVPRAQCFP